MRQPSLLIHLTIRFIQGNITIALFIYWKFLHKSFYNQIISFSDTYIVKNVEIFLDKKRNVKGDSIIKYLLQPYVIWQLHIILETFPYFSETFRRKTNQKFKKSSHFQNYLKHDF